MLCAAQLLPEWDLFHVRHGQLIAHSFEDSQMSLKNVATICMLLHKESVCITLCTSTKVGLMLAITKFEVLIDSFNTLNLAPTDFWLIFIHGLDFVRSAPVLIRFIDSIVYCPGI